MRISSSCLPLVAGAGLLLAAFALSAPLNHDESQYVAGAVLAAGRVPFRDFLALQPPLALWAWAPLTLALPGWSFVAIRLSSALFGLVTLIAVANAERRVGSRWRWPIGAALLACSHIFLFTSGVARNDALPGMLLALGMAAGLRGIEGRAGWLGLCGLLLGAAGAAKLSFLPSLATAGLLLIVWHRKIGIGGVAAFSVAALLGLLPLTLGWAAAPEAFWFGVFRAGATIPFDWYRQTGDAFDLTLTGKLIGTAGAMLVGPVLVVFLVVAADAQRLARDPAKLFLLVLAAGGLVGGLLPTPTHPQYLLPLLPPLFALLPATVERVQRPGFVLAVLVVFAIIGAAPSVLALPRGFPAIELERQAHVIGRLAKGPIATLSPDRVADSGWPLDARFATGPFVFRSGSVLSPEQALNFNVAIPAALAAMFAAAPPAAILVGYEKEWRAGAPAPDQPLELWARAHGYRALPLSDGRGRLYLAPDRSGDKP